MNDPQKIELFLLKCAVIENTLRSSMAEYSEPKSAGSGDFRNDNLEPFIRQFALNDRINAAKMAKYYEIFYMLENDIRRLIVETLETAHGAKWWEERVPQVVREEAKKNRAREDQAAVSPRSDDEIDYITFGQLWDIIRENWADFAGSLAINLP
jgi:hypothetical protein